MKMNLPKIGPLPAIGLGTWRLAGEECDQVIKEALEYGYRHFDTADVYNNHAAIGQAIKGFPREQLFIVSKIIYDDLQPKRIRQACEKFLKELQTPYLDLLLIHWPSPSISSDATLKEMVTLKEEGFTHHIGVSNFTIPHLQEIEGQHFPILTNQIELHPYLQEEELVDYCQKKGIIVTAYRPIQKGEVSQENVLKKIGTKYHKTAIQVTLRWLFQRDIVSIPKAASKEHLLENLAIFDFSLSEEEMEAISSLNRNQRFVFG